VDVYAVDDQVELFVNGISVGRKAAGAANQNKVSFEVTYQPGTIEAVGYKDGKETGRFSLATASAPAALVLTPDRSSIPAGSGELFYVTLEIQDQDGLIVKHGEPLIHLDVSGAGELIGIGSGNPLSEEMYVGSQQKAYHGRLLAIVRSTPQPGEITLQASMAGLPASEIRLNTRQV
jgi:beta-galactosidase